MNRPAREAKSVQRFVRSNGLDTALYKKYLYLLLSEAIMEISKNNIMPVLNLKLKIRHYYMAIFT